MEKNTIRYGVTPYR